jgi:hypothetical protein
LTAVPWDLEILHYTSRGHRVERVENRGEGGPDKFTGLTVLCRVESSDDSRQVNRRKYLNSGQRIKGKPCYGLGGLGPHVGLNSFYLYIINVIFVAARFSNRDTFPDHLLANCVGPQKEKKNSIPIV